MFKSKYIFVLFVLTAITVFGQVDPRTQKYRDDLKGDIKYRREGTMDGNLVRTLFYNNGEVGQWPYQPSGEWPKGSGHSYLDGLALLIASEITAPGNGSKIHPLETCYREWMDYDPNTGQIWGLEPLPGYINPTSTRPAINTNTKSWPSFWPSALDLTAEWNGYWYGYFGRGVQNSDFETFYVMDDSKDKEFTRLPFSYFPIANDSDRGGLGLRVEVRGFQWSHVLAEDIIFWHYDIVSLSDNDMFNTLFGYYSDLGVGGTNDSGDDMASFSTKLDMAYGYDGDGFGVPDRWKTGLIGYAYLESPGNGTNGIDDDEDGIVDEKRDDGIDNDHDWIKFTDLNSNGKWDKGEPLNDDLGKDGVGPFDPQYNSPDEGEGDGLPTHGEPNFDQTDKDESDQIGLSSVALYRLGDGGTGGGWPKDDEAMWLKMNYHNFDTAIQRANISMVFASGPFPLLKGKRERFSLALLFGTDLEDLVFNKETVQQIYNANYNFSKPPLKPTLKAVAGDGKVFLYWNSISEESRDPFLGYQNNDFTKGYKKDFEGYLVYRSREAEFNDIKVITDSKGAAKYWKPVVQFDLIDSIAGPDPIGINGASFWRGSNTGLQHSYVDTDVKNGVKYYYALVAYDMGDPKFGTKGLQPSECTKIITEDFAGNIQFTDINCAVVVPNAPAAGYVPPQITGNTKNVAQGVGTGSINVNILNPGEIKDGAAYKVEFAATDTFPKYTTLSYKVIRMFNSISDTLLPKVDTASFGATRTSEPFDGMSISVFNDTTGVIDTASGWISGSSNMRLAGSKDLTSKGLPYPCDYQIDFYDTPQDTTYFNFPPQFPKIPVKFKVNNLTTGKQTKVVVKDMDGDSKLSAGDEIQILEFIGAQSTANSRIAWVVSYANPIKFGTTPIEPIAGDKFLVKTSKPFKTGDYFNYGTKPNNIDNDKAQKALSKIDVVPNPYLGAVSWEARNLNATGRGNRKIDFINLPAQCTIRVYTVAGALVKTIVKDNSYTNGSVSWNMVTEDGMDIAFGVYIYHVDAPGVGEHIGKFAVIK